MRLIVDGSLESRTPCWKEYEEYLYDKFTEGVVCRVCETSSFFEVHIDTQSDLWWTNNIFTSIF